jgi:hypothetical protein
VSLARFVEFMEESFFYGVHALSISASTAKASRWKQRDFGIDSAKTAPFRAGRTFLLA